MRIARLARHALGSCVLASTLVTACADDPVRPPAPSGETAGPTLSADGPRFTCTVSAGDRAMTCAGMPAPTAALPPGLHADRVVGGQDGYVNLASPGSTYDPGTGIFDVNVTVQNLVQTDIGTTDGTTAEGVTIFLLGQPTTVQGTGTVTATNADGFGHFTAPNGMSADQPYWVYSEILEPYRISNPRTWRFSVPSTVVGFEFTAYVSIPMADSTAALLDAVWDGSASTDWFTAANWARNVVPGSSSVIAIPSAARLGSTSLPQLTANAAARSLRVGQASTLALGGYTVSLTGNLDAVGTISGGTVTLSGTDVRLGGQVPALVVSGSARLQRPTVATGAVTVTGSLAATDRPLVINVP